MAGSILRRCWAGPKLDQGEGDTPGDDVVSSALLKTMPGGAWWGFIRRGVEIRTPSLT